MGVTMRQCKRRFHKVVKPYTTGYLTVSDGHKIYYECSGNPQGIPIMQHDGGPGAPFDRENAKKFSPAKYNIILYAQRGSIPNKPLGIKNVTTQAMVEDIKRLMDYLNIKTAIHYGPSWGSTLALCFAIKYPQYVYQLILLGIWLGNNDFDKPPQDKSKKGTLAWKRFTKDVPKQTRPIDFYHEKLTGNNKKEALYYVKELFTYEGTLLEPNFTAESAYNYVKNLTWNASLAIEVHFLKHNCFLPKNYILQNAQKLDMPITIIHGKDDFVCPVSDAKKLHQALPNSTLHIVKGGHLSSVGEKKQTLLNMLTEL